MHKHNILYRVTQNPFSLYYYSPLSCQPFESITISCSVEIGVNNGKNTYEYTCLCLLMKRCSNKKNREAKCIIYWKSHSYMFTNPRNGIKYIYISFLVFHLTCFIFQCQCHCQNVAFLSTCTRKCE